MPRKKIRLALLAPAALLPWPPRSSFSGRRSSMARLRGREEYQRRPDHPRHDPADRLGCYGFRDIDTPTIDRFAREGIRFERCFAQTPLTLPSHTTIMTGTYPPYHGVRDNGGFIVPPGSRPWPSPSRNGTTRPPRSSPRMSWTPNGAEPGIRLLLRQVRPQPLRNHLPGTVQRPANESWTRPCPGWRRPRPASSSPGSIFTIRHTPYEPPPPFDKKYRHPYLGEIAFADSQLGRLWDFLEKNKLRDKTLIVFCADHGESLGAHRKDHTGSLFTRRRSTSRSS